MLLAAIAAGSLPQTNRPRLIAVAIFIFTAVLYDSVASLPLWSSNLFLDYGLYYIGAGAFNLLAVYALYKINHATQLIIDLQIVCLIAMALNAFGFALYMAYLPTDSYRALFPVVYWLALIALFKRDDGDAVGDAGGFGVIGRSLRLWGGRSKGLQSNLRDGEKA